MDWTIELTKTATKQLKKLDRVVQKRIIHFFHREIENTVNPRCRGKALKGEHGELWRYRVGDYRMICQIKDKTVTVLVLAVGHRKESYSKI